MLRWSACGKASGGALHCTGAWLPRGAVIHRCAHLRPGCGQPRHEEVHVAEAGTCGRQEGQLASALRVPRPAGATKQVLLGPCCRLAVQHPALAGALSGWHVRRRWALTQHGGAAAAFLWSLSLCAACEEEPADRVQLQRGTRGVEARLAPYLAVEDRQGGRDRLLPLLGPVCPGLGQHPQRGQLRERLRRSVLPKVCAMGMARPGLLRWSPHACEAPGVVQPGLYRWRPCRGRLACDACSGCPTALKARLSGDSDAPEACCLGMMVQAAQNSASALS